MNRPANPQPHSRRTGANVDDIVVPTCCGLCVVIPASELDAEREAELREGHDAAGPRAPVVQVSLSAFLGRLFGEMVGSGRLREST